MFFFTCHSLGIKDKVESQDESTLTGLNITLPSVYLNLTNHVTYPHVTSSSSTSNLIDPLYNEKQLYHLFSQDESILPVLVIFNSSFFQTWMGLFLKCEYFCPFYFTTFTLALISSWIVFNLLVKKAKKCHQSEKSPCDDTLRRNMNDENWSQVWKEEPSIRQTGVMLVSFKTEKYTIAFSSHSNITSYKSRSRSNSRSHSPISSDTSSFRKEDVSSITQLSQQFDQSVEAIIDESHGITSPSSSSNENDDGNFSMYQMNHFTHLSCPKVSNLTRVSCPDELTFTQHQPIIQTNSRDLTSVNVNIEKEKEKENEKEEKKEQPTSEICIWYHIIVAFVIGLFVDGIMPIIIPNTPLSKLDQPIGLLVTIVLYHLCVISSSVFAICYTDGTFIHHVESLRHIYSLIDNSTSVVSSGSIGGHNVQKQKEQKKELKSNRKEVLLVKHKNISFLIIGLMVIVILTASSIITSSVTTMPRFSPPKNSFTNNNRQMDMPTDGQEHKNSNIKRNDDDPFNAAADGNYNSWIQIANESKANLRSKRHYKEHSKVFNEEEGGKERKERENEEEKEKRIESTRQQQALTMDSERVERKSYVLMKRILTCLREHYSSLILLAVFTLFSSFIKTVIFISWSQPGHPICCLDPQNHHKATYDLVEKESNDKPSLTNAADQLFLFSFINQLSSGIGSLLVFLYISFFAR